MKPLLELATRPRRDALLIACAVLLAYANALGGPFQFDDYTVIVDAGPVHSLAAWWADLGHGLRPLLKLSYWLDHTIGFGAAGFHGTNVLIHLANALLVRGFAEFAARRWLPQCDERTQARAALLSALIFALHPANTEAVSYISARSVSLMSLLLLLALAADRLRSDFWSLTLALLAYLAALAVKEPAVTLAPTLWLLARFGLGRSEASRWRALPFWLLPIGLALWLLPRSNYEDFLLGSLGARSIADNLLSQIAAVFDLLKLALLLRAPNLDPPLIEVHRWSLRLAMQLVTMLALLLAAFALRRTRPWLAFGAGWFVLQLLPTNSLLPRNDLVNDRQLYFAGIGLWLIVGLECAARGWLAERGRNGAMTTLAMFALCGSLAVLTHLRNRDYCSEIALWRVTALASPDKARPWNNLGYALQLEGCRQAAIQAYDRALAADPQHLRARHNREALLAAMPGSQAEAPAPRCREP